MQTVKCVRAEGSLELNATYNVVRRNSDGLFITGNGLHNHGAWPVDYFEPIGRKHVLLLSGGLDSTTLLWELLYSQKDISVECLTFDYGQRHSREIDHARRLAKAAGCHHVVIKIPQLQGSYLTGGELTDPASTVVPNRNMIFLSIAANYVGDGGHLYFGCHAADHEVYPDCRPDFIASISNALKLSCNVTLHCPFVNTTRQQIVAKARLLKVPVEDTWSCYTGGEHPCGYCPACQGRDKVLTCSH